MDWREVQDKRSKESKEKVISEYYFWTCRVLVKYLQNTKCVFWPFKLIWVNKGDRLDDIKSKRTNLELNYMVR